MLMRIRYIFVIVFLKRCELQIVNGEKRADCYTLRFTADVFAGPTVLPLPSWRPVRAIGSECLCGCLFFLLMRGMVGFVC